MWYKDDIFQSYWFEKENGKVVCGLHPKPTRDYAFYLLRKFFENEGDVTRWYETENFWYGQVAPKDMTDRELIMRVSQMIDSVYI